jgi:methylglutaconyl-CoA hydratase
MSGGTLRLGMDARGVAEIRLDRPDKRNAMSAEMISELADLAVALGRDPAVRAVVLAAEGKVFSAGADLNWMQAQIEADRATRMAEARRLAMMLFALNTMPKPLIGRVHGDAFGGAIGLLAICDTVVAVEGARFALTETRLGLIPATIGPYVIARLGEGPARRVFMSARELDADEAKDLGLVSKTVPAAELDAAIEAEVVPYLLVAAGAVGRAKALARMLGPVIDEAVIEATIERLAEAWDSEEAKEGIAAFLEKRPPSWAP